MNNSDKPSRKSFEARLRNMVDHLVADIYEGRLAPGEYLPSEKSLTEQYNLSNKSVRKGLQMLVEAQLIVKVDRVGSRVVNRIPGSKSILTFAVNFSIERDISLSALLDDFHSLHPDIYVKTVLTSGLAGYAESTDQYLEQYLDQAHIDVMTLNNSDFEVITEYNCLPLLEVLPSDPQLYSFAADAFTYQGTLYARPLIFSPVILAYNRAHFRESGVPEPNSSWTWNDCLRVATTLTEQSRRHGFYFYLLSDNRWPAFLLQSGMKFEAEADGSFQLANTRLLESIRLCKQIISDPTVYPSYLSENSDDVTELFMQGRVSMIMTNYMTINECKNTELEYDISPLPNLYEPRSLMNVIGVAMNRNSKNKEAAKLLVDYLTSSRAQDIIRERTLSLPARTEVAESSHPNGSHSNDLNRPLRYGLFREIMPSYRLHRELNLSSSSFGKLRQLLKKYWSGLMNDTELCEQVALLSLVTKQDKGNS